MQKRRATPTGFRERLPYPGQRQSRYARRRKSGVYKVQPKGLESPGRCALGGGGGRRPFRGGEEEDG